MTNLSHCRAAPLKWQLLANGFLLVDLPLAAASIAGRKIGLTAVYRAATCQIILYTMLRDRIIDVPREFAASDEQRGHFTSPVIFQRATLVLVTFAAWSRMKSTDQAELMTGRMMRAVKNVKRY